MQEDYREEPEISTEEQIKKFISKVKEFWNALWASKWRFIGINFFVLVAAVLYLLFVVKPYFNSSVTILPDYGSKSSMAGLSSLASLAGISVGEGPSTEIYANLAKSESILEPVINHKYNTQEFKDPVNLIEYFEVEADESLPVEEQKRQMFLTAYRTLAEEKISTNVDRVTKILTIDAQMPESKLSAEVVNRLVKELDDYVRNQRKSFAKEQRQYLEKRIGQVKDSLTVAENKLKNFVDQNRNVLQSPQLMLEQERMKREVEILQAIYIEITKQLEVVKLEEIKDTPVVNVREYAKEPVKKSGPKRAMILIVILFFSVLITGAYYIFKPQLVKYKNMVKNQQ